jgi:hypothetical protein
MVRGAIDLVERWSVLTGEAVETSRQRGLALQSAGLLASQTPVQLAYRHIVYSSQTSFQRGVEAMNLMDNALRWPRAHSHISTRRIIARGTQGSIACD